MVYLDAMKWDTTNPDPPDSPAWLARLAAAMAPWAGAGVVVAVSGGGDSVGLLRGLVSLRSELSLRLSVACLDHGTRAGASAEDAAFVADLAASLDLPWDLGHWRSARSSHFEADARRARYAWLLDRATDRGSSVVAVGHTSDDQAETILHRIVRGTGLAGLAGMAPRRPLGPGVSLARPLLGVSRCQIRDYLITLGQDWREDASNRDPSRTRTRIRHDLLPKLADDYNPGVADALIRLGRLAGAAARQADRRAIRNLNRVTISQNPDGITLDRDALRRLSRAGRTALIRLAWRRLGWPEGVMSHARWERLGTLMGETSSGRCAVGGGAEAVATPDRWTLRRRRDPRVDYSLEPRPLAVPGSVPWRGGEVVATLDAAIPAEERVDLDSVEGPLIVRSAQPGDRFAPLGLNGQSQPLADFCRGRGIPRLDRPLIPILADARGIIWVASHRIAHRVRQTEATIRTLGLRYAREIKPS